MKRFFTGALAVSMLLWLIFSCNVLNNNSNNNDVEKVKYDAGDGYYNIGVPIIHAEYLNR
jgi:hypothetical protein